MKILVVSQSPTHPTTAGNRKLILSYSEMLKGIGHDVYFLYIRRQSFHSNHDEEKQSIVSKQYWGDHYFEYKQSFVEKFRSTLLKKYRAITNNGYMKVDDEYPQGLSNYVKKIQKRYNFNACIVNYYFNSKLLIDCGIPKTALFTHDYFSYKNLLTGEIYSHYQCLPNEEAKACQRAKYIFAMQDEEAAFFQRLAPNSRILINYSNFDNHKNEIVGNHNLLFLSGPNQYNIEGIKWFIDDILPEITKKYPDAKLVIGGGICKQLKIYEGRNDIELKGFIENPASFWSLGDIAINPTFNGTGLKIKTFESISYNKVTLVHPHSLIGIYKKESAPIFSSNSPNEWVNFLDGLWVDTKKIQSYKDLGYSYINDMNDFIKSQYLHFLND